MQVSDEAGEPVAGAEVGWIVIEPEDADAWRDSPDLALNAATVNWAPRLHADAAGRIDLAVPVGTGMVVFAAPLGHQSAARRFAAGAVPDRLMLTVCSCGRIAGRIEGMPVPCPVRLAVVVAGSAETSAEVDAGGAFQSPPLLPGEYRIRVQVSDATQLVEGGGEDWRVPLLFSWDAHEPSSPVHVQRGETTAATATRIVWPPHLTRRASVL